MTDETPNRPATGASAEGSPGSTSGSGAASTPGAAPGAGSIPGRGAPPAPGTETTAPGTGSASGAGTAPGVRTAPAAGVPTSGTAYPAGNAPRYSPPPKRTSAEIRADIEAQRAELGKSVEHLRDKVTELTDWRAQVRKHRKQIVIGAVATGFIVGGLMALRRR